MHTSHLLPTQQTKSYKEHCQAKIDNLLQCFFLSVERDVVGGQQAREAKKVRAQRQGAQVLAVQLEERVLQRQREAELRSLEAHHVAAQALRVQQVR